ncbi:MAG: hypothetical protein V4634_04895 [Pseudomonadota bacterium]
MSISKKLTRTELESLYSAANSAIWHSHQLANAHARRAAREEDYVATLVTNGVPLLADRWISVLEPKGIALKISGVFCHGHPQVAFGIPQRQVELADLLIIHQHSAKTRTTARALLVQAKMSTDATHRLPTGDQQLYLFSTWPKFEFVTGGLARGLRDLKEIGKGSRYALVLAGQAYPESITWADQCPWGACHADQLLSAERSFSKVLGDILLGKDGRIVQLNSRSDEWSRTIKELLEVTGTKTYRRTNIGRGETSRLSMSSSTNAGVMFLTESSNFTGNDRTRALKTVGNRFFGNVPLAQADGNGNDPPTFEREDNRGGGISMLVIETREVEA